MGFAAGELRAMIRTLFLIGRRGLLVGQLLLFAGGAVAADQPSSGQAGSNGQTVTQDRGGSDSRVLSTKPTKNNGVKTRVLTRDGRVRDLVVESDRKR